jgi:hypothetical protein
MRTFLGCVLALSLGAACASTSGTMGSDGVLVLKAPDRVVLLSVTLPDGTKSELAIPDGEPGTVKAAEIVYAFVPKIGEGGTVMLTVMQLEPGEKPTWKELEKLALGATPVSTKTTPSFALKLDGIKKAE